MTYQQDSLLWSEQMLGGCRLGDPRRKKRLIAIGALFAQDPGGSLSRICCGDKAAQEGMYKFVENDAVRPEAIAEGIFSGTAKLASRRSVCLAIQDSTVVDVSDGLAEGWKEQGSPAGFQVHSTLLVDGEDFSPIGLIDQARWLRAVKGHRPGKATRATRRAEEKESYKWTASVEAIKKRVGSMDSIITVGDRESDIFDFLLFQHSRGYRFVIRATHNRALADVNEKMMERLERSPVVGKHFVDIEQRGSQRAINGQQKRSARTARIAETELRAAQITLSKPRSSIGVSEESMTLNAVLVTEPAPPEYTEDIQWVLLTTEPVATLEQVLKIVQYYSARWLIEEFHKAWKTGCRIEERRLQTFENFERVMVITAAVAVRLLQLRCLANDTEQNAETALNKEQWQCLYAITEKGKQLPSRPPTAAWAYYALAKLAGWTDSKRTGIVGWQTLWLGWERLQFQLVGWNAAMQMFAMNRP